MTHRGRSVSNCDDFVQVFDDASLPAPPNSLHKESGSKDV
jgi:hypothetical protein